MNFGYEGPPGGAMTAVASDHVIEFARVVGSSIGSAETGAVLYNIAGISALEIDLAKGTASINTDDNAGEGIDGVDVWSALGIVGRPLDPTAAGHLEVVCLRTQDGLVPISARDLRLRMAGNEAPGLGVLALVGYGGGFHSLTPVDGGDGGTIHVIYCPYDFNAAGVAQKAHSIILDPTSGNESITISHGEGMAITMLNDDKKALVLKNASGDATFRLDDDGITMTATRIVLSGGVTIGDPLTASPPLAGTASQGSTKLYLSL